MLEIKDGKAGTEDGKAKAEDGKAKTRNAPDARSGGLPVTA
jgi:hypothetical protein